MNISLFMEIWTQPIDPLGYLPLSFLFSLTPIIVLIILLCIFRISGWKATLISSISCFVISLLLYRAPFYVALSSYLYGVAFGLWPISWIVLNAVFLYNIAKECGCIEHLSEWVKSTLPNSRGLYALFIAFLFGGLIEGVDGYGFPIAMSATLLISLGFNPIDAVCASLLANTVTVPFASLGVPIETLSTSSGLDIKGICIHLSLQLALISVVTAPLITRMLSKHEGDRKVFETSLIAGAMLGISIYIISAYMDPRLAGILAPLASMLLTIIYVKVRFKVKIKSVGLKGWVPWIIVSSLMGLSGFTGLYRMFSIKLHVPSLHESVFTPLYGTLLSATYELQPLAHGTIALFSALLVAYIYGLKPSSIAKIYLDTWRRMKYAILTISEILGLAFLMNYTGLSLTLGYSLSHVGPLFPILSGFIGWIGTFVSGSETGSNALFGSLQRMAAELSGFSPYMTTSLNAAGGVLGKMVSIQSITIGLSAVESKEREGEVMRRLIGYSLALTLILGLTAYFQVIFSLDM
ncbi:L-lactate permease [Candidatus Bathyarchaeota archaeon]|nr:L-lactate permease [Candidatus Bathyarchaeota archaeon]